MKKIISVSIIEDIEEIRLAVKTIIEQSKEFVCYGAFENAEEAAEKMSELNPDIFLVDINLPGMSGIDFVKKVKNENSSTQFMMFTIYEDSEKVFDALAAGASGYLLKNTPNNKILVALKELYDGGSPMSTNIARKVVAYFQKDKSGSSGKTILSEREKEVLELLSKGLLYKEVSQRLKISTGTVRQHVHKIYNKLHVQNRTEAINKFFREK
jgi:DNA-binding NarL/FixJ family response regulator